MKTMKYETVVVGALETNCYLVYCENSLECAVVDPGADPGRIIHRIADLDLIPKLLINTHGHIDHIGANRDIVDKYRIPIYIHQADEIMLHSALQSEIALIIGAKDSPAPEGYLIDGAVLSIGDSVLKILHTPGHSQGSVCLLNDGFVLSGDTLFCGGVGRTDLPGGSWDELAGSIRNILFSLPDDTTVLPGHGPKTTILQEKNSNPFVR